MNELSEYGVVILVAVIGGASSFLAIATVLAVMEAMTANFRRLRAR